MRPLRHLHLDPAKRIPLLREQGDSSQDQEGTTIDVPQGLPVSRIHTRNVPPTSSASSASLSPPGRGKESRIPTSSGKAKPRESQESAGGGGGGGGGDEDAGLYFVGNATTVLEWQGLRVLTDPNFLHAGDHVHLGPGVTAQRLKDPVVDLEELPPIDMVLLSHYHEDHFDRIVEGRLNRDFAIVTTPHAKECLTSTARYANAAATAATAGEEEKDNGINGRGDGGGPFRAVHEVDTFESVMVHIDGAKHGQVHTSGYGKAPAIKITAMPGKHVPPGPLAVANDLLGAVPPTNGWLLEMGWSFNTPPSRPGSSGRGGGEAANTRTTDSQSIEIETGYRIYISGDTLFVDELREIPRHIREQQLMQYPHAPSRSSQGRDEPSTRIDLMIIHLGGTTIPGPRLPLLMVTMDAAQGVELMRLLNPALTIPVHFDDYSVMLSSLEDFKIEVANMGDGWEDRVVYLGRGEQFRFRVRGNGHDRL